MRISFRDEAGDTFRRVVDELDGYNVRVEVSVEDDRARDLIDKYGGTFIDCELLGADRDSGWCDALRLRELAESGDPIGDAFTARVSSLEVF